MYFHNSGSLQFIKKNISHTKPDCEMGCNPIKTILNIESTELKTECYHSKTRSIFNGTPTCPLMPKVKVSATFTCSTAAHVAPPLEAPEISPTPLRPEQRKGVTSVINTHPLPPITPLPGYGSLSLEPSVGLWYVVVCVSPFSPVCSSPRCLLL